MTNPEHFRQLYEDSEAEGLGLTFAAFAEALWERLQTTGSSKQLHLKDLVLAQACTLGIPSAWERFSHLYRERLYAMAVSIAKNDSLARELADSMYGDLYDGRLASYSGRGPLEAWLRAVLSQKYVDRYRSQRRTVSLDDRLAGMQQTLFSGVPAPVDPRLNKAIQEAFLALPAESRYLLAGYFFDQRTLAELAGTLGVHESTASRRLDRLIKLLRKGISRLLQKKGMTISQIEESFRTDVRDISLDLRSQLVEE